MSGEERKGEIQTVDKTPRAAAPHSSSDNVENQWPEPQGSLQTPLDPVTS